MPAESDVERTHAIAERALELMRTYGASASPRSYEVWYTYVTGERPAMNDALKRVVTERGTITEAEVEALHAAHVSPQRFTAEAEKTSASVIVEIDDVMEMIDLALGSTERYGESLQAMSAEVSGGVDRKRVREILEALVVATKDVSATNRTLEARLKETRGEIESLRETLESVRIETLTDPLTGIANRKHFEEMLVKSIDQSIVEQAPLSLIVIDIDHFKRFNDTYGHLTGDQVLRLVSMTMREQIKTKATLARFGGEEFGIILPHTNLEGALTAAERVRVSVMGRELVKRSTGESLGKVTVSLGVATLRRGDTSVSMLERADQCMFASKRGGRNRTTTDGEYDHDLGRAMSDVA
ncbi:GGDEF domain-containing protein [Salinarimonas soli]|uniref:diguanylate cyclase n=1 Tax=Salinarimonas soli TaxID=1638099 RepID=A0A5B2VAC7_9HYPH|nr:GGDEF domain-containing protein [Salinarimonas soli]KAA2235352.1 GGDEF domain-containing protein [Salinarimonas soli]